MVELNKMQKKIVKSSSKNILVLACPGSGKTTTIIERYHNLIVEKSKDPSRIILTTFTKKSGEDIKKQLKDKLNDETLMPKFVGTIHKLAYDILKDNGLDKMILDDIDSQNLLTSCIEMANIDDYLTIRNIKKIIQFSSIEYPFNIEKQISNLNMVNYKDTIIDIYKDYTHKKNRQKFIDFNDLMILFCDFLNTKEGKKFLKTIDFIFFDEYQDVNQIQNYILKKFNKRSNIMVVGDDDQAIYSFRGSNIKYIYKFKEEFKDCKIYKLNINYRSNQKIIDFYSEIIKDNNDNFKKCILSNKTEMGTRPLMIKTTDKIIPLHYINQLIKNNKKDIAILARTNSSIEKMERLLIRARIPCILQSGLSLLNKDHIILFMAFCYVLMNEYSEIHWKKVTDLFIDSNCDAYMTFLEYKNNKDSSNKKLNKFIKKIGRINDDRDKIPIIIKTIKKLWKKTKSKEYISESIKDIKYLVNYFPWNTFEEFITEIHLKIEANKENDNKVLLTTFHGSKGLEWENVFLIDVNFNKIKPEEIEEERRILYVAASRAKDKLFLLNSNMKESLLVAPINNKLYKMRII